MVSGVGVGVGVLMVGGVFGCVGGGGGGVVEGVWRLCRKVEEKVLLVGFVMIR